MISTDDRPYLGRIEVFLNHEWGKVCFQEDNVTLSVICSQLGFGSVGVASFASISTNSRVWLSDNINCIGNEDTIFDCLSSANVDNVGKAFGSTCDNGEANVICSLRKFCTFI